MNQEEFNRLLLSSLRDEEVRDNLKLLLGDFLWFDSDTQCAVHGACYRYKNGIKIDRIKW